MDKQPDTSPKPFVFVLMPFSVDFKDIYESGIKSACEAAGAYCERVDEQLHQGSITQRIYNQIAKADIIVADMSNRNPNVFYETGYAHALGKQVILLTQCADDIPFDLKDYPHIVYGGRIFLLKPELEKRLRRCIEHPMGSAALMEIDLDIYVEGVRLGDNPTIKMDAVLTYDEWGPDAPLRHFVHVAIHNPSIRYLQSEYRLGLGLPRFLLPQTHPDTVVVPDDTLSLAISEVPDLYPDEWRPLNFPIDLRSIPAVEQDKALPGMVCLFTGVGKREYTFSLILVG
jgi:hypothetical protein